MEGELSDLRLYPARVKEAISYDCESNICLLSAVTAMQIVEQPGSLIRQSLLPMMDNG